MYPQQKYTRDWMRLKKKLVEMSPEERTKYRSEHCAKVNEARFRKTHRIGSKSDSTGPIFLEEDTQITIQQVQLTRLSTCCGQILVSMKP